MAGGVHASSPGPATVTHQMGHSVLPPEYALHSRAVIENGVNVSNETGGDNDLNVASSTTLSSSSPSTRKRKYSGVDNWNLDYQSKRMRVCYQFLFEMILEKEKYLYVSLLDEYGRGHENDIFAVIDKNSFSKNFVPFVHPQIPKSVNFLSEPEHFRKLFPNDVISKLQPNKIKQELDTCLSDQKACSSPVVSLKSVSVRGQSTSSDSNSQHIVEKAKQEAYVLQRVAELQKCGMWTEKRLPKVHEPHRMKAHWDYVLEELEWLATDFAQERKWKKAAARKRSRMIQKHFQEREALVQKALRAAEVHKRKIASHLAKIVKTFWSNVEKLVDFKQQTMLKEKRQQALDQHLSFIVNKTEQYSSLVAESMNRPTMSTNENSRVHSPSSDADFEPNQVSSSDDEETIEAEEKASIKGDMNPQDEISMLQRESKLPIEDLVNRYVKNKHEVDDDYEMDEDTSDDERTIMESEKQEGNVDHAEELAELEEDQKLSLADLKRKYYSSVSNFHDSSSRSSPAETSSESEEEHSIDEDDVSMNSDDVDAEELMNDENNDLISLMKDSAVENGDLTRNDDAKDGSNEDFDDVAAIAESIQPKGNTLSSTSVVTKVPFLLKHTLREYQHIGLDWLVTMYERKLNGILADEMGLGKTIQTIALLAHLASDKENWGPHLIIVPTSVMLNWEMEIKKWCPAFKILTYYGNPKERKLKRAGWTKPNTFHVCITSYKLILQDHYSFRRKKWQYLILDEAQNIKNFKSQRWQRLLNFDSERRLLLTGTPLQNNLMELWSMMHFLMPNLFSSHKEFKEWFSNPVSGMIEGNSEYNENIIKRLHKILRPFLLRRLKVEVEKQLPQKYEHVVMCRLSNRQRYLYDDFMSRAKTKETLSSGNLLSVINVLMQLRKVCNHPNLFEQRPIISPFQMENLVYHTASLVDSALEYDPLRHVSLNSLNLRLIDLENDLSAWCVYRLKKLKLPRKLIEEIDESPPDPPPLPKGKLNIRLKTPNDVNTIKVDNNVRNNHKITTFLKKASASNLQASGSSASRYSPSISSSMVKLAPIFRSVIGQGEVNNMAVKRKPLENSSPNRGGYTFQVKRATKVNTLSLTKSPTHATLLKNVSTVTGKTAQANAECIATATSVASSSPSTSIAGCTSTSVVSSDSTSPKLTNSISQLVSTSAGKSFIFTSASAIKSQSTTTTVRPSGQRIILTKAPLIKISNSSVQQGTVLNNGSNASTSTSVTPVMNNSLKSGIPVPRPIFTVSPSVLTVDGISSNSSSHNDSSTLTTKNRIDKSKAESIPMAREVIERRNTSRREKLRILAETNEIKSSPYVMFGCDVRNTLKILDANNECSPMTDSRYWNCVGHVNCVNAQYAKHVHSMCSTLTSALSNSVKSIEERIQELCDTFSRYIVYVPAVNARRLTMHVSHPHPSKAWSLSYMECALEKELTPRSNSLHQIVSRMSTAFPDSRLIQYDCGKLQTLDTLLRRLKLEQHRVLIFTQMARMLDVLEAFLTFHGYIYLRLDGSTRIDQRQVLMERFNADKRYFCFILSTRSGGIGVNLTGADTVIFYDSDWNPTMDAQAQDRCHRIGQTRDVHIYRLISEKTIEENILKKANQKKLLGELAIEGGNFTAAYFKSTTIHDLFTVDLNETDPAKRMSDVVASDAPTQGVEKATLNAYENALAAAEDETDVVAARTAKEEAVAELAEFDETIPLVDNECGDLTLQSDELSKAEQEVNALIEQLTPVERWALQFMETVDTEWADEQLAAAEAEIEQQKKEWEMERMAIEQADEQSKRFDEDMEDDDSTLTYRIEDSKNQAWISIDSLDYMPIWLPLPTNPSAEEYDVYVDHTLKFLYETTVIPEHLLPPVYTRKEKKKLRLEQPSPNSTSENASYLRRSRARDSSSSTALSVASLEPPKSLFDRPSPIVSKLRHDMRLQKYRGLPRSTIPNVPGLKPYFSPKVTPDPEFVPDWMIHEDYTLLRAIQHVQELPLNLSVMYPGHTPNWDLISELVNQVSVIYRSPQQCKNRFEITILPREEGKLSADPLAKKNKKVKGMSPIISHKHTRSYKTTQQYLQDSNGTFTKMMNARFDAIRAVSNRRAPTIRRLPITTSTANPRHAQLLAECDIDFDRPLTPVEIATKRAQRLAKEKQTQMASAEQLLLRQANVSTGQQQTPKAAQPQPAVVQQLPSSPQIQQQLQSQIVNVQKAVPITASNVVLTQQQVPPTAAAVVVSMNSNPTITAVAPILTRTTLVGSQVNVQEMIVTNKLPQQQQPQEQQQLPQQTAAAVVSNNGNVAISSPPQKIRTIAQISTPNTVTVPRLPDGKLLTSAQVHFLRQQQALQRQPHPQFAIFRSRSKTPVMVPANVVVSSSQQQTRQIKSVTGPVTTSAARTITEAEVQALLKKQQPQQQLQQQQLLPQQQQPKIATSVIATTNFSAVQTAQFLTTSASAPQAKTAVGIPLSTIKTTTINASNLKTTGTVPQFRQITIPQTLQQRKITTQKVTPIGQVMVNVTQSGQVFSQVLTKSTQGSVATAQLMNARVIPFISSPSGKPTIQVVNAASLRPANTSTVTVDTSGARHIQPTNTIKISSSPSTVAMTTLTSHQHLLNQVSAALQGSPPLAVRQANLKIQGATMAAPNTTSTVQGNIVSATPGQIITLPTAQSQQQTIAAEKVTIFSDSEKPTGAIID